MRRLLQIITYCVLGICISNDSFAHKGDMTFHYLMSDDGLTQNRVRCILRDSRENMWFGTYDGLNRYNGRQVAIYRNRAKDFQSISCEQITDIIEDADKNIWAATEDGLNLYIPDDDSFVSFKNIPSDNSSISGNYINCIYNDNQHNVWFGVDNGKEGLNRWNPHTKTFTRYQITNSNNRTFANAVTGMVQDKNGNIWVASRDNGLFLFEPDKSKFTRYNDPLFSSLGTSKRLFIDDENMIWVSTYGDGLFSFDPIRKKFTKYNSSGNGKGTSGKLICNVIQEDRDNLLIAIDQGGINRLNKRTHLFEYINAVSGHIGTLNNDGIWCLYKDKEGILWVGTSGGGVNIYNPKSEKFKLLKNIPGDQNSLSYDVVGSIYEDSKGLLWIATDGGGVSVYNRQTKTFKNYKNDRNDPSSIPCNVIRHVVEDRNHDYWLATWDGGLIKLDHKTDKFTQYLPDSKKPYDITCRNVWNNVVDHNGIIWLSMTEFGVDLLDPDKGIIERFRPHSQIEGSLSQRYVNFMYEDSHSNMWLCTCDGLNLYDSITNSFKVFGGFPSNDMRSFIEDKEGCYWAGTINKGIIRFKMNGDIMKVYDTSNGLPSNLINGILEDENKNIWISTGDGISRINYKTGDIRNYTIGDGLQGRQFFLHSCLKTSSGEMYFGGFNGLNSFFPDSLKDNDYIPKVYINEFLIFNKPVTVGQHDSPLLKVIEQTNEMVLSWEQSVFSFGFVAINYTHPEQNKYAYMMEGFDKDWNYTDDSRRLATYTNLDAGTYTFKVKASNNDGLWNETGTSIKITILPPWWRTWWFKTFFVLLIVGFSLGYYYYRIHKLKKQKKHLEYIVKQRTSEVQEKNYELLQQTDELRQMNEVLIENHQRIEKQDETLRENSNHLKEINDQLTVKQNLILSQSEDLKETNIKLTEANAAKDKFFSIISHDLRSPFNSFLGLTELMAENLSRFTMDEMQELSLEMKTSATSLFRLLENLLQWSKMQQGSIPYSPELLRLIEVVEECIAMTIDGAKNKGVAITYEIPDDLTVIADSNMIQTVIRNLVSNALKFTPKDGKISISAKTTVDRSIEITIADTGIGMTNEMVNNLFRLDVRTNREGTNGEPSSGLGLLLCKEFVEKQGGRIWVESEVGKGTLFYFTIRSN